MYSIEELEKMLAEAKEAKRIEDEKKAAEAKKQQIEQIKKKEAERVADLEYIEDLRKEFSDAVEAYYKRYGRSFYSDVFYKDFKQVRPDASKNMGKSSDDMNKKPACLADILKDLMR